MSQMHFFFFLLLSFSPFNVTKAQSSNGVIDSSIQAVKVFFQNEMKESLHLYTGKEYHIYEAGIKGSPSYMGDKMQNGEVFYDGSLYKNVYLLFDIVRQVVVINQYQQESRIQLLSEKIEFFTLGDHRFETFLVAEGNEDNVNKVLCEVVFTGKTSVLAKRIKKIKKGLRPEDPYLFVEEDEYYLKRGSKLYNVSNKNDVLQALDDKKYLVKSFTRKNRLKFSKDLEQDLIATAKYYSTLN